MAPAELVRIDVRSPEPLDSLNCRFLDRTMFMVGNGDRRRCCCRRPTEMGRPLALARDEERGERDEWDDKSTAAMRRIIYGSLRGLILPQGDAIAKLFVESWAADP